MVDAAFFRPLARLGWQAVMALLLLCLLLAPGLRVRAAESMAWTEVSLSDIPSGEAVAVTITSAGRTYLLTTSSSRSAPEARAVTVENGFLSLPQEEDCWTILWEDGYVSLHTGDGWLYTHNGRDGLRVGDGEDPRWQYSGGNLIHLTTQRYLHVDTEKGIWHGVKSPDPGQSLQFWQKTILEPSVKEEAPVPETEETAASEAATQPEEVPVIPDPEPTVSATEASAPPEPTQAGETLPSTQPPSTEAVPETVPESAGIGGKYKFYFGQLHAHTDISDGVASVEEAFFRAAGTENLDFFAVTDHSDSFDNSALGSLSQDGTAISRDFASGKAAAAAVTGGDFVGIYGFEMSWPRGAGLGHISTFATPGWQSWKQADFSDLEGYYAALASIPGAIGQFNHPGDFYGNFENFAHYDAAFADAMALLEVGGEGGFRAYGAYTQALDAGWRVAPTSSHNDHTGRFGDAGESRTVILAEELTEEALYDAMRQRRVYATDDGDLEIYYCIDGQVMGSVLGALSAPEAQIQIYDPTDSTAGYLEVIADGGTVLAAKNLTENRAELTIPLPGGYSYYYLRITQPDGDIAVTAPVWCAALRDFGIKSFTASTGLPVQGKEISLEVTVFNDEAQALELSGISFFAEGVPVSTLSCPGTVPPRDSLTFRVPYTHSGAGTVAFSVRVSAAVNGQVMEWEQSLSVSYRAPEQISGILADSSHGNFGTGSLSRLTAIAAEGDMEVISVTGPLPAGGSLLLITAPATEFEASYIREVRAFLDNGGTVLICGHAGKADALNELLSGIGSTIRLGQRLSNFSYTCLYNEDASLTKALTPDQFFHHSGGCTLDSGDGQWLVRDPDTGADLLAWETLSQGGRIIAAGSLFLTDKCLPVPANRWDVPSANQSVLEAILGIEQKELPVSTIAQARRGQSGDVFRIRGYVTAGTSDAGEGFPGMICLQDDTGGIPIVSFTAPDIQVGTPLDVIGCRTSENGNIALELIRFEQAEGALYRYTPHTIPCEKAMDYQTRGGRLLQVQGKVKSFVSDGSITRLVLKDEDGGLATVVIGQSSTLAGQIKRGRTVRAMGILFLDENRESILRARDPEEVVSVPPSTVIPDRSCPKTGDSLFSGP